MGGNSGTPDKMAAMLGLLLLVIVLQVEAAKILLVPIPTGSHVMNFQQMAEALVEAGHEIHVVTDVGCKSTKKFEKAGAIIQAYATPGDCAMNKPENVERLSKILTEEMSLSMMRSFLSEARQMGTPYCDTIFNNHTLFQVLKSENYDLCISDGVFFFRFLYLIPYKLNLPFISFLAAFNPMDASIPGLPSFTPVIDQGRYSSEMNFFERLMNTIKMLVLDDVFTLLLPSLQPGIVRKYAPEKPAVTLGELAGKSELWLVQNDIAVDYPQVRLPHVVDIGGTNTGPAKPLPEEFLKILQGATHGVVIVSFGSMLATYPADLSRRMLHELRMLKQTVIWRHDGKDVDQIPPHIHLVKWFPQNDLLAHPTVKVFVTHCGANGQFEALYHAVPMLGLPLFADQFYNAKRMEKKGMGIVLDMFHFKPGVLRSAIEEMVSNRSYQDAVSLHSQIFRDRPLSPKQTLVFWVKHFLKYGSKHLRSVAISMPWYKYWCIDVIFTLLAATLAMLFVVYKVVRCSLRFVCRKRNGQIKKSKGDKKLKKQ